jgi:hypothetical protein
MSAGATPIKNAPVGYLHVPPSDKETVPTTAEHPLSVDSQPTGSGLLQKITDRIMPQPFKKIVDCEFEIHNVDEDCELREYVSTIFTYKRGCAYYEIRPEGETVFEDQELIFVKVNKPATMKYHYNMYYIEV